MHSPADADLTRRTVLAGLGAVGALAVAGCGGSDSGGADSGRGATSSPPASNGGAALARVDDIPLGSAISATHDGAPVIIARPDASTVVAFSAKCTHRACTVKPAGQTLNCPCHGSKFEAATGKVLNGPATAPLTSVPVKVTNGEVVPA